MVEKHLHHVHTCMNFSLSLSYLLARPMLSGFGGGISRHTEGISISRPPGPVTSHLLRCELSFRIPSFPFRIPFCSTKQTQQEMLDYRYFTSDSACVCVRHNTYIPPGLA